MTEPTQPSLIRRTPSRPQPLGGQSVPRIYYYRTRHNKPDSQAPHENKAPAELREERPVLQTNVPPLEEVKIHAASSALSKQRMMQIGLVVAILLLALWWVYFFGPSVEPTRPVIGKDDQPRTDSFWEGRMRGIAKDEFGVYLGEKSDQIKRLRTDLAKLEEMLTKWNSEAPKLVADLKQKMADEQRKLDVNIARIDKKVGDYESTGMDYVQKINSLRSELQANINKIAQEISGNAEDRKKLADLSSKLNALEKDLTGSKADVKNVAGRVSSIESSLEGLKSSLAAQQLSLKELKESITKQGEVLVAKEKEIEERVKAAVIKSVSDSLRKEILDEFAKRPPPIEKAKLDELTAELNKQKEKIAELAKKGVQPTTTPSTPTTAPHTGAVPSVQEIVKEARPEIEAWITAAVAKATPDIIKAVKAETGVSAPTQPGKWLDENYAKKIPGLITEATQKVSDDLKGQLQALKNDITKLERLTNKAVVLDSTTKELIIQQLKAEGVIKGLTEEEVIKLVENRIDLYAADRVNMTDYALETGGAKIIHSSTSPNYRGGVFNWLAGTTTHSPTVILSPVGSMRGKCWAFKGSRGFVTIQLPFPVKVSGFTLEHIPRSLAVTPGAAPRKFQVLGVDSPYGSASDLLGEYEYILREEQTVQTFTVQTQGLPENATLTYQYIALSILSNYGNPDFTCVYRFRIHGEPAYELEPTQEPTIDAAAEASVQA